jgi:hypothetical protein
MRIATLAARRAPPPRTSVAKYAMSASRFMLECASTADVMMENQVITKMQIA